MYSKENPKEIKELFDTLAPKYDFLNNIISFGVHNFVKRNAINLLKDVNYPRIVDLCTGTGDIAFRLAKKFPKAQILAVDFSSQMLKIAKSKLKNFDNILFEKADCTELLVDNNTFNLCTIAFGLRNLKDINSALSKIYDILKPSGELLILDAVRPMKRKNNPADFYFKHIMPAFASLFGVNKEAYKYLANSRDNYPSHKEIQEYLKKHNFEVILQKEYCFGMFSLNIAKKR